MCLKKNYVVPDLISVNCSEEQNLQIIVKDTEGGIHAAGIIRSFKENHRGRAENPGWKSIGG